MLLKKDTYAYNQIMFGVLALNRMFEREVLDDALAQTTLSEAYEKLSKYMPSKDQYLLDFIFNNLFIIEDDTKRILEAHNAPSDLNVTDFLISHIYSTERNSVEYTSGCIEDLASSIFWDSRPKTIMDIGCGQGIFLTKSALSQVGSEYYGIEVDRDNAMISKLKMSILNQDIDRIQNEDVFSIDFRNKNLPQYDAVFCHMPMMERLDPKQLVASGLFDSYTAETIARRAPEWAYIRAMQQMIQDGGKGIAVVRSGLLYTSFGKNLRKELIDRGVLEGVILLPENLLTNTSAQTALLILSNNNKNVRMVNASKYYEKGRRLNILTECNITFILDLYLRGGADICGENEYLGIGDSLLDDYIEVTSEMISDNDYSFDPMVYILNEKVKFSNEQKLSTATSTIFRGAQIKSDKLNEIATLYETMPNCYLLTLSNISNGYIDENLEEVNIENIDKYEKYMIQEGDLIISARGTKVSTAVAKNIKDRKIIATGNLIVIRCNDSLEPYYLKAFFESSNGQSLLKATQTGSLIFAINPKQLRELSYDAIDIEKQRLIAEKTEWLIDELHECNDRIARLRQNITRVYDSTKGV